MSQTPEMALPDGEASALPQARLSDDGPTILVLPPQCPGSAVPMFEPFGLPQLPKSLTDWLAILGERFRARHGRSIAAVLLLDTDCKQWSMVVPAQRCDRDASCWSASRKDFPDFPRNTLLAGSFQSRLLSSGEEPADCPPPHDGLHLVSIVGRKDEPPTVWCFVRAGCRTRLVRAVDLIADDWENVIVQALPRITLT